MRTRFEEQLSNLNIQLIKMASMCEEAILSAIKALINDEPVKLQDINNLEERINSKEREIEGLCMTLLLQQQPVAKDLRIVSSALKMISDMERIGDQALDIAEISQYIKNSGIIGQVHIKDMADEAIKMLSGCIDSFVKKDVNLAKKVIESDDIVDGLFDKVKNEIRNLIATEENGNSEYYLDLLMVAKYMERIGDHATNIAEWVIYYVTGEHV